MANTASNTANMTPESDSALVAHLHTVSAAKPKLIKSTLHPTPVDPCIMVRSWKMDEFRKVHVLHPEHRWTSSICSMSDIEADCGFDMGVKTHGLVYITAMYGNRLPGKSHVP
ncbi:hypothetical protein B0H14DRAFT_2643434 [Mycena olivaceomarginata]|nr:hypothetical protein B0H14DRAFT_2643434 [Mycena olivaceomarginata]